MKFGTFYFFQATPGERHADIIRGCLDQDKVRRSMELSAREVMPSFK